MYNWMQSPGRSHEWALDYMTDLSLPVNFVGQSNIDRRLIYPMKEVTCSETPLTACAVSSQHS